MPKTDRARHYRLSDEQKQKLPGQVLDFLAHHVGASQAICAREIAQRLQIHDPEGRMVRRIIRTLIDRDHLIACNDDGAFLPTPEESLEYLKSLYRREIQIRRRRKRVARNLQRRLNPGRQLPLL